MIQTSSGVTPARSAGKRKIAMQMVVGMIVGAGATYGLLSFVGESHFDIDDPSRVISLITGVVFLLTGLFVALGVLAPRPGAHLLNVEDADELREQRGPLWRAALGMVLLGLAVLALALSAVSGSAGLFPPEVAGIIAGISFIGLAVFSFVGRNDHDELMRSVSRQAMSVAMYACTALLGIWAGAAHLGYVDWIRPLDMINALLIIQLAAIVIVSARRGLFRPR